MSRFADQPVLRMPPLSTAAIARLAEGLLEEVAPEALTHPAPFPVLEVFEDRLERFRIYTYAVADESLPDAEAVTDPSGRPGDDITIRIRASYFDDLVAGGRIAFRPRATLPHELGHAVLHVPVIRRRLQFPELAQHLLQRRTQSQLRTFEQSEWQAWTMGGCVLMPPRTLRTLGRVMLADVSRIYQVSEGMARSQLNKMRNAKLLGATEVIDLF